MGTRHERDLVVLLVEYVFAMNSSFKPIINDESKHDVFCSQPFWTVLDSFKYGPSPFRVSLDSMLVLGLSI